MFKFSIIIPAYNVENYIDECVMSVLKQSIKSYQIIIIDDCSSDDTWVRCKNLRELNPSQIFIFRNESNQGLSITRNIGIEKSIGEYVLFLDGDDFWISNIFLEKVLALLSKHSDLDLIIFPLSYYFSDKKIAFRLFPEVNEDSNDLQKDLEFLIRSNIFTASACNKIVKKTLFKQIGVFPESRVSEDIVWCANLLRFANKYAILNEPIYMYRQNRVGSITYNISERNVSDILLSLVDISNLLANDLIVDDEAMYLYMANYYVDLFPYVYPYLSNKNILLCLKDFEYLFKYKSKLNMKRKAIIAAVDILGYYRGSFVMNRAIIFYRYLLSKIAEW